MFSQSEFDLIKGYAKWASSLCIIRADWDEKTKTLKETTSKYKISFNYLNIALVWFFFIWGSWRMERVFISMSYTSSNSVFNIFFILMGIEYAVNIIFRMAFTFSNSSLLMLFNQMQTFVKMSSKEGHKIRSQRLAIYQKMYLIAGFFNSTGISLVEGIYMWNITDNNVWLSIWIGLMLQILMWEAFTLVGIIQMYMFLYFGIISSTLSSHKLTWDQLNSEKAFQLIKEYCGLTILANNFNQTYCKLIVPAVKYVVGLLAMICVLIAIRLRSSDSPGSEFQSAAYFIVAIYFFALVAVGAHLMSEVWQKSTQFLSQFSEQVTFCDSEQFKKCMSYQIRSLRPIRFGVGGMYYMEKEAKITLIDALLNGTASLLLTF